MIKHKNSLFCFLFVLINSSPLFAKSFLGSAWPSKKKVSSVKFSKLKYKVICDDPNACEESVAGLITNESNVCTGVLIEPDLLLTNLHCLPLDLRKKGVSCKKRMQISFPQSLHKPELYVDCKNVVSVSASAKDTPLTPDYAFLRLEKKINRQAAQLNTSGIENNELLTIFKIDPDNDFGLLRKINCKAAQGSILNPLFLNAQSSVVSLIPCDVVSGNSGSPVFSENHEVKAIINSQGIPSDIPIPSGKFSAAFATNFSCIDFPSRGKSNQTCLNNNSKKTLRDASIFLVRNAVHPLLPTFTKKVTEQLNKIDEQTKGVLRWDIEQQDIPFVGQEDSPIATVAFKPKCILTSATEMDESSIKPLNLSYSEWGVELHLDTEGRPAPQLAERKIQSTLLFLNQGPMEKFFKIQMNQKYFTLPFCDDSTLD